MTVVSESGYAVKDLFGAVSGAFLGRLSTPADIGNVTALLCSPDAGWITGQVIYADGGASIINSEAAPEIQLA